jgi:ABC-type transporter Mla maintaining outer membrane lipid asymmetry ATPase subunit MlaF
MTGRPSETPVLSISGVHKKYAALRPLRITSLAIARAERVAVIGFDAAAAELIVNLVTGASLPDEGEVRVFGRNTTDVANGDEWLASLDRFGIVTDRAVLLEGAPLSQNLALPFTLEIDPMPPDMRDRVGRLAHECDIAPQWLEHPAGGLPPAVKSRAHLARAIALGPALLLMEHPTAALPESDRDAFAAVVARVCESRQLAALMMTADVRFATIAAHRTLTVQAATGVLRGKRAGWF